MKKLAVSIAVTLFLSATAMGAEIRTFTGHTAPVSSVAFSPDGTKVLTGSNDSTVKLWDAATGAAIRDFTGLADVTSVAFSPDGTKVLAGSGDSTAKLWDAATGTVILTFTGHTNFVMSVAFSPDGTKALTGGAAYDSEHAISYGEAKLWYTATGTEIHTFTEQDMVTSVAFSPDGTKVLTGSAPRTIKLRDAVTGAVLRTYIGYDYDVTSMVFSPDGTKVLTGAGDNTAKLWDVTTGTVIRTFTGHTSGVHSVAFSPDGTKVLTGSNDHTAKLWNANTGSVLRTFTGHTVVVSSVAFSPDGTKALTGSADATAKLWVATAYVPNVVGMTQTEASEAITGAELTVGTVTEQCSNSVAEGLVISQNLAAGGLADFDTAVDLTISTGLCNVNVPNVVGLAETAAGTTLSGVGLVVGTVTPQCSNSVSEGLVISQNPLPGIQMLFGSAVNLMVSTGPCNVAVPNVVGLTQTTAGTLLSNIGLSVGTVTEEYSSTVISGTVISQSPVAGVSVSPDSAVALTLSKGPQPVPVPDVVGQIQSAATSAITNATLSPGTVTLAFSATVPSGSVISQSPVAGTIVVPGTAVALVVSQGPQPVTVPNVIGQIQTTAQTTLIGSGLAIGVVTEQYHATIPTSQVISQNPTAGTSVSPGTSVALVISKGVQPVTVPNVTGQTQTAATTAINGVNLTVGAITQQCANTVGAGQVISQVPTQGTQLAPGSSVALVVSTGQCSAEGEGEGENTQPTEAQLRDLLAATFDAMDTNGDGGITYSEALAALPGLPVAVFNAVDTDGNGQISRAEAGLNEPSGCAGCKGGKSVFTSDTIRKALGDLFLAGLSLSVLGLFSRRR